MGVSPLRDATLPLYLLQFAETRNPKPETRNPLETLNHSEGENAHTHALHQTQTVNMSSAVIPPEWVDVKPATDWPSGVRIKTPAHLRTRRCTASAPQLAKACARPSRRSNSGREALSRHGHEYHDDAPMHLLLLRSKQVQCDCCIWCCCLPTVFHTPVSHFAASNFAGFG